MSEYLPLFDEKLNAELELTSEQRVRLLGAYGVYDASFDNYETNERPEDDQWIIRGME